MFSIRYIVWKGNSRYFSSGVLVGMGNPYEWGGAIPGKRDTL
jgi:hypothetical protein